MKTVVITGAGGFIGGALAERLLHKGITVHGVDVSDGCFKRFREYENFVPVIASFQQYETLHEKISGQIDVFYHFAWQGTFGDAFKDYGLQLENAKYSGRAIDAAIRIGAKKVRFSRNHE